MFTWLFKKNNEITDEPYYSNICKLNVNSFKSIYSSDISYYEIVSYFETIDEYINFLQIIINTIKDNEMVKTMQLPQQIKTIYLRNFYTNKDNKFVDPVEKTQKFKDLTIEFLKIYEQIENKNNQTFTESKNLFLCKNVVSNLIILFKDLDNEQIK